MERSSASPDAYLATLPDGIREDMTALDAALAPVFEGDVRVLWEGLFWGGTMQRIIGYGDLRQKNSRGVEVEWFVVGIAVQKANLSLYVAAAEDGQYLVKRYADRLGKVKVGSSNVNFRRLSDLNLPVVVEMATLARDVIRKRSA